MTMHEERDIDDQLSERRGRGGGGGRISLDPRVSIIQNWILGIIGMGIVSSIVWGGKSIANLNETMVRYAAQNEFIISTLHDQNDRIKDLERRNASRQ